MLAKFYVFMLNIFGQQGTAGICGTVIGALLTGLITHFQITQKVKLEYKYSHYENLLNMLDSILKSSMVMGAFDYDEIAIRKEMLKLMENKTLDELKTKYPLSTKTFWEIVGIFYRIHYIFSNKKEIVKKHNIIIDYIREQHYNNDIEIYKEAVISERIFQSLLFNEVSKEMEKLAKVLKNAK